MASLRAYVLVVVCYFHITHCKPSVPGIARNLGKEVADSFKVMKNFPFAMAVSYSEKDTMFRCLDAIRTEIDLQARTATYVLRFPSKGQSIPFHVRAGNISGEFTFYLDDDLTTKKGRFYYTDYKSCVVEELEYQGHQCILWVRREVKDSVPQGCIDQFVNTCGVEFPAHSRDLCDDNEDEQ